MKLGAIALCISSASPQVAWAEGGPCKQGCLCTKQSALHFYIPEVNIHYYLNEKVLKKKKSLATIFLVCLWKGPRALVQWVGAISLPPARHSMAPGICSPCSHLSHSKGRGGWGPHCWSVELKGTRDSHFTLFPALLLVHILAHLVAIAQNGHH